MARIGLLSDTHNRPHPRVFGLFDGVDRILHAGDICTPEVLVELEALAPVTAVHGNCCTIELQEGLPARTVETHEGWRVLLQHDIGRPVSFRAQLERESGNHLPDIVVSGHSHTNWWEYVDGIWFANPGSAGPARFRSRPMAAILTLRREEPPNLQFFALENL